MIRLFHVYFPSRLLLLAVSEAVLIAATLMGTTVLRVGGDLELALIYEQGLLKICIASAVLMLCMYYYDLYNSEVLHEPVEVLPRLVQVLGTTAVILGGIYYLYPMIELHRGPFLSWIIVVGFFLAGWRRLFGELNRSLHMSERTVLLGGGKLAGSLTSEITARPELGIKLIGYLGAPDEINPETAALPCAGQYDDLKAIVRKQRVDRVIVTMSDRRGRLPVETLLDLKGQGLKVQDSAEVYEAITGRVNIDSLRPSWLLFSDGFRVARYTLIYKRVASIVLSLLGILLTAPLMVLIAAAIKLDSPGPVMFLQKRIGKGGAIFTIFKFRSMSVNADRDGTPRPAAQGDQRVTRVGKWLRRLHLDELPQLFNILRGDMYFVGPRPFTPNMEQELCKEIPFYSQRWIVKPGATGWAQINRGYCETLEDNFEKLSYDLFYVKNLSFGLDCLIIFQTFKILLLGRGGR